MACRSTFGKEVATVLPSLAKEKGPPPFQALAGSVPLKCVIDAAPPLNSGLFEAVQRAMNVRLNLLELPGRNKRGRWQ